VSSQFWFITQKSGKYCFTNVANGNNILNNGGNAHSKFQVAGTFYEDAKYWSLENVGNNLFKFRTLNNLIDRLL